MATYAEAATWCGYEDDDAFLRGIDLPMPLMDLSRRHGDYGSDLRAMLSVRIPAASLMSSLPMEAHDDTPTTPTAVLKAPRSYDGDDAALQGDAITTSMKTPPRPKKKQPQRQECGAEYDADIDAAYRIMETDPGERPSEDYLSRTQAGGMMMSDRAELIEKMHRFTTYYELAPGTLHRAVSYVDRFLSSRKITGSDRQRQGMLPSVVAASAIILAKLTLQNPAASWSEDLAATGYALEDLHECMDAIREMHELQGVWPGCAQMMEGFVLS